VSGRQTICRTIVPVNLELLHPIHTLQRGKPLQRHFGRSRDELQKLRSISLIK